MVTDDARGLTIRVLRQTKDTLDSIKHPGQSYDGLVQELIRFWTREHSVPSVSVILVMDSEDEELLFSAVKSGASACLTKDVHPEDLVSIVREVAQGGQPIGKQLLRPGLAIRILDEFEASSLISRDLMTRLTPREAEILRLTGEGSSPEQVAANLGIGEETVSHHLDLILSKLVANDRSRQLIEATKRGLAAEHVTREAITQPKESESPG